MNEVEFFVEDTAYETNNAVSTYRNLLLKGVGKFIVIGSPMVLAIKPPSESEGVEIIALLASSPEILKGTRHMLRHSGRMDDQGRTLAPVLKSSFRKNAWFRFLLKLSGHLSFQKH